MFWLAAAALTMQPPTLEVVRQLNYRNNDHSVKVCRFPGMRQMFYETKMSCDVDGSPNAYHPLDDNLSLDVIESAGGKRKDNLPNGALLVPPAPNVVVYQNGAPYIQPDGEFKGFYVSETSLENAAMPAIDPNRYLDARKIQFVVLPGGHFPEVDLGDFVLACDPDTMKTAFAVYGDEGPGTESGEASLATHQRLGFAAVDGKSSPGEGRTNVFYLVFPKSSWRWRCTHQWPLTQALIDRNGNKEFRRWGGMKRLKLALQLYGPSRTPSSNGGQAKSERANCTSS